MHRIAGTYIPLRSMYVLYNRPQGKSTYRFSRESRGCVRMEQAPTHRTPQGKKKNLSIYLL